VCGLGFDLLSLWSCSCTLVFGLSLVVLSVCLSSSCHTSCLSFDTVIRLIHLTQMWSLKLTVVFVLSAVLCSWPWSGVLWSLSCLQYYVYGLGLEFCGLSLVCSTMFMALVLSSVVLVLSGVLWSLSCLEYYVRGLGLECCGRSLVWSTMAWSWS